jgi:hypothetical protein
MLIPEVSNDVDMEEYMGIITDLELEMGDSVQKRSRQNNQYRNGGCVSIAAYKRESLLCKEIPSENRVVMMCKHLDIP